MDEWQLLYASLYSAQINGNAHADLPYLDSINNRAARYSYPDQPVTFAVLYYHYQSLKPNTLTKRYPHATFSFYKWSILRKYLVTYSLAQSLCKGVVITRQNLPS